MGGSSSKISDYELRLVDTLSTEAANELIPKTVNITYKKGSRPGNNYSLVESIEQNQERDGFLQKLNSSKINKAPSISKMISQQSITKLGSSAAIADQAILKSDDNATLARSASRKKSNFSGSIDAKVDIIDLQEPPTLKKREKSGIQGRSNSILDREKSGIISRSNSFLAPPAAEFQVSARVPWIVKGGRFDSKTAQSKLELRNVLGAGLMGTVRLAEMTDMKGNFVAVKNIRKDYIIRHNDFRHVDNERQCLYECVACPFCIRLFGTFQDHDNIYFIMEYAAGGELFRKLSKKSSFSLAQTKFYACEIFLALFHVQSLGYVYRDLKPENIMLDEYGHCKLVDFGFCIQPDALTGKCTTNVGTPAYLSPEQLNGKFTGGYTKIVDWWSFGVLLYELLTGSTPFCKDNKESAYEIYLRVLKGSIKYPRKFDSHTRDLISSLLNHDLQSRLVDPLSIKAHGFFSGINWEDINARRIVPPFVPKIAEPGDSSHFDDIGAYREFKTNLKGKNPDDYNIKFLNFG